MRKLFRQTIYMLLLVLCMQSTAIAQAEQEVSISESVSELESESGLEETSRYFQGMARKSRLLGFNKIFAKWHELKDSLQKSGSEGAAGKIYDQLEEYIDDSSEADLRIFISRSMGCELIKRYALEAKKYGGVLVLRGLPDESWQSLSSLVLELADMAGVSDLEDLKLTIDDELFSNYGITSVPSFVLAKKNTELESLMSGEDAHLRIYDKLSGNIGVRRALEVIVDSGDLSDLAGGLLAKAREVERDGF